MSDDGEIAGAPDPAAVSQPLPPEVPMQRPPAQPELSDGPFTDSPEGEWWRRPAPPTEVPAPRSEPAAGPGPDAPVQPSGDHGQDAGDGAAGQEWWRSSDVREEWRDTWATHGQDGIAAATEIGSYIGDAIASRLPDPHAAAAKRGLDLRWLRLKYNIPALFIALLVTWRSQTAVDRMTNFVAEDGIFAPLGAVLLFVLLLGLLMVLPIGSWLASAFSDLVSWLVTGLIRLTGKAWTTPYIGYVLRLIVAVAIWSFVIAVVRVIGRAALHFLTGA
ncbi:hypothetical protein [Streptomyces scabiei]|uniref:hypothetical protein n=1 Tax=Streptomyces scabiei TaxID=1930 RepID=UPI0029B319A2|nr:hypothetical protein [Streptomyces scabiei]MDX2567500.1 hypothetical protein [Streptomyces scabiei]